MQIFAFQGGLFSMQLVILKKKVPLYILILWETNSYIRTKRHIN